MHKKIGLLFLAFVIYVILGVVLPPLKHKKATDKISVPSASEASGDERILCIDDNEEALLWRLRTIEEAKEEIIFATFDFRDDNSGKDIMAALLQASSRGVQVKILVDGINGFLYLENSPYFKALVSQPNVEAKLYNPVNLLIPWKLNYRMHDKYLIADDALYLLGGRNTNDLFLGDYSEKKNIDRDILVYETENREGNTLHQLKAYFQSVWELSGNKRFSCKNSRKLTEAAGELETRYEKLQQIYPEVYEKTDWILATMETESISLCTNPYEPENKEPQLWHVLQRLMMQGEDIVIQTPYIICSKDMYDGLFELTEGGRRVQIMINAIESGANPFGCIDYVNQKKKVQKTGVEMYECIGNHSLHTKTILIDDSVSVVGSYNLDMRSTYLDTEMMLVIKSSKLNASLRDQADVLMEQGKHVLSDGTASYGENYPDVSLSAGKQVFYGILKVLIRPFRHLL